MNNKLPNDVKFIIEPFCGIFGFSRAVAEIYDIDNIKFILNDINSDLITDLKNLQNDPENIICGLLEKIKNITTNEQLNNLNNNHIMFLVGGGFCGNLLDLHRFKQKIKNFTNKINYYKIFLKKCEFYNMDYLDFLKYHENKFNDSITFYDPPYMNSNNVSYNYYDKNDKKYYDDTKFYIDINDFFKNNTHRQILGVNDICIITHIFKEYKIYTLDENVYQTSKRKKNHINIQNF